MNEKPILFSSPMVLAILEGRKTQTRRVINPQPSENFSPIAVEWYSPIIVDRNGDEQPGAEIFGVYGDDEGYRCLYGAPGDRLWVKETFKCEELEPFGEDGVRFRADGVFRGIENSQEASQKWLEAYREGGKWRPSIFMPRWASRITLEVVNVRVERVRDIKDDDAKAEGATLDNSGRLEGIGNFVDGFAIVWDKINKKRGFGWDVNPWVWVVEFKVV